MIGIDFGPEAERTISRLLDNIDYTMFYQSVGNILEDAVASQFESDGAYFQRGMAWMPLKPATIRGRVRQGFEPDTILRRTAGDAGLMGSIASFVENDGVRLSTNKFYAPYLFFGTKFMPARPFFPQEEYGLPPDVMEDIQDAFATFMKLQFM